MGQRLSGIYGAHMQMKHLSATSSLMKIINILSDNCDIESLFQLSKSDMPGIWFCLQQCFPALIIEM
jgi:hypothetical protein